MTSARSWVGSLTLLALLSSGCGEDPPKTKPKGAAGGASAADGPADPNRAEGSASGAAPEDTAPPPPPMEFRDTDFAETEQNRDPFRPFTDLFAGRTAKGVQFQRKVVLEQYAIDELKLIGIVSGINPAKAMLVDPNGQGHVVHRGDFVGKAERVQTNTADAEFELTWRIERIRDADLVLVREDPSNPDIPSSTRVLALRPEEGAVK